MRSILPSMQPLLSHVCRCRLWVGPARDGVPLRRALLRWRAVAAAGLIAVAGLAAAGPLEDGYGAYQLGDYAKAYALWRPLAEADDAQAQLLVGTLFAEGKGVDANPVRAVFWLTRAANAGVVEAQYRLGLTYYQGEGVPRDLGRAVAWWEKAALQGDASSLLSLARLYHTGEGVTMDLDRAQKLYQAAAERGSAGAQQGLVQLEGDRNRLAQVQAAGNSTPAQPNIAVAPGSPLGLGLDPSQAAEALQAVRDASWIKAQPPTRYTVQLFAARAPESVKQFLLGFNGGDVTAVYSFNRKDELWYAVVYGSYEKESLAELAVKRLVTTGNQVESWIRRFGNIQALDPH